MTDRDTHSPQELLPIGEVAKAFCVAVSTVRAWEKAGKLAAIRTPGGQRRFRRSQVESILRGDAA